jgi:hypothetical protein
MKMTGKAILHKRFFESALAKDTLLEEEGELLKGKGSGKLNRREKEHASRVRVP